MRGCGWNSLQEAADEADPLAATLSDGDSNNNVQILAAAIVFARTGDSRYRDKVISANELLRRRGKPSQSTLRWGRELGAYVVAADLVGYRTASYEAWLRQMAEVFEGDDGRTLVETLHQRPNNWGTMAFGTLAAVYAYLEDSVQLRNLRLYWESRVEGPMPEVARFGDDTSWQFDVGNPLLINPIDARKSGLTIDGIVPDDMRRNGSFSNPPPTPRTSYHWETLQGMVMAARILERSGEPIWMTGDRALFRAFQVLQDRWSKIDQGYRASGDDVWMLPFIDHAYGSSFSAEYDPCNSRIDLHGKNIGWPWVLGGSNVVLKPTGQRRRSRN